MLRANEYCTSRRMQPGRLGATRPDLLSKDSLRSMVWIIMKLSHLSPNLLPFEQYSPLLLAIFGPLTCSTSTALSLMGNSMRMKKCSWSNCLAMKNPTCRNIASKLYKSLYGLNQAGCKWYKIMCCTLAKLGFKKCEANQAVFYIQAGKDILILAIHVNDCTMTGSSDDLIQSDKLKIKSKYDLTDLGPIHWLLSIKITQDCENCTILLSQSSYINSVLR